MSNKFAIYDLPSNQRESLTVFDAAERGDVKVLMKLSKMKGFDVNSKDKFGRTALMWAADCGQARELIRVLFAAAWALIFMTLAMSIANEMHFRLSRTDDNVLT